jgi:taurine transport system substrate-binding protein
MAALVVALAVTIGLTACGGSAPASSGTAGPMPTLRVAYAQGLQTNFYHAMQNGLFEKSGVKVVGTKFDSGPALVSALVAGSVDVGYFGMPALVTADAKGAKLQTFGIANEAGKMAALYVNPSAGIASISDLKGKTVATTQNTVAHIFLLIALKRAGIDPKDVNIQFIDPTGLVAGYARGDINAVYMFASVGAKLIVKGATLVESTSSHALGLDDTGNFIANQAFIKDNTDTLRKFLTAVDQATPLTNGNRDVSLTALKNGIGLGGEEADIIYNNTPSPGLTSSQLADPKFRLSLTPNGGFSKISQEMVTTMIESGIVKDPPPVDSMITASVVEGMK